MQHPSDPLDTYASRHPSPTYLAFAAGYTPYRKREISSSNTVGCKFFRSRQIKNHYTKALVLLDDMAMSIKVQLVCRYFEFWRIHPNLLDTDRNRDSRESG